MASKPLKQLYEEVGELYEDEFGEDAKLWKDTVVLLEQQKKPRRMSNDMLPYFFCDITN